MDLIGFILLLFLIFIIMTMLQPTMARQRLASARQKTINQIEKLHGSRLILMIHRQKTMSLVGFPVSRYIDIEDSEATPSKEGAPANGGAASQ